MLKQNNAAMQNKTNKVKTAIIGSGNIGTDLMLKILSLSNKLEMTAMIGIDEASDGLKRAADLGVVTSHQGIDGLVNMPEFGDIEIVFDATSASAHQYHYDILSQHHKAIIDLTPAAIGPYIVPVVNLHQGYPDKHLGKSLNMVTCGGQATIPMVYAVSQVGEVVYAEIIASISSYSAGPGTRQNIDEFTETTATAIEQVGGATKGKAIIILNPAEPPLIMRNTVYCLSTSTDTAAIKQCVASMVKTVQQYVPGYRLKQEVQFEEVKNLVVTELKQRFSGTKVSIFLEVKGEGSYLPTYAGNLDIMTSAAMYTAERVADQAVEQGAKQTLGETQHV